jgi:hypothetical protein
MGHPLERHGTFFFGAVFFALCLFPWFFFVLKFMPFLRFLHIKLNIYIYILLFWGKSVLLCTWTGCFFAYMYLFE